MKNWKKPSKVGFFSIVEEIFNSKHPQKPNPVPPEAS